MLAWLSGYVRHTGQINKEWEPEPNSCFACLSRTEFLNLGLITVPKGNLLFNLLTVMTCPSHSSDREGTQSDLLFVKLQFCPFGIFCGTFFSVCVKLNWKITQNSKWSLDVWWNERNVTNAAGFSQKWKFLQVTGAVRSYEFLWFCWLIRVHTRTPNFIHFQAEHA